MAQDVQEKMSGSRMRMSTMIGAVVALVVVIVAATLLSSAYIETLPERISRQEAIILGQNRLAPGSQAALRVVVRNSLDGAPLPDAAIRVSLKDQDGAGQTPLYQGKTDVLGLAEVVFRLPENLDPKQVLVIETRSPAGVDTIERPVTVARDYRVLISSDKPVYQPGQVIHLRLLGLSAFDLAPAAGQPVEFVIADGKGNKVFRKQLTTSDYGVASADFQLAGEVSTGNYKISASLGNTTAEKTVRVENYVLPKYKIVLTTEKTYYQPGETVRGALQADYFFGKPVAKAEVRLDGFTFDVQQNQELELQGQTDAEGRFEFEFSLPKYLAGSDLEGGLGRFYLEATLIDATQHSEKGQLSLPVSKSALIIEAIPEGGQIHTGVENIIYILTSYPDGTPAVTDLTLFSAQTGDPLTRTISTGPYGLAEVRLHPINAPVDITITARDAQGNRARRQFAFRAAEGMLQDMLLLRPDKPVYRVGDGMKLTILTATSSGTVYLDIVRAGQTISTRAVEVKDSQAELTVDLTPEMFGMLELHAYKLLEDGTISRDTRLVVVDQAEGLQVALAPQYPPGAQAFRPGEQAGLDIQVRGKDGQGAQAALGLAIVDEAVFALTEQDPGFARLYFLLEQELLQPKYELHGYSLPDLVKNPPLEDGQLQAAAEGAAQAALAERQRAVQAREKQQNAQAEQFLDTYDRKPNPGAAVFSLQANSHQDALKRAEEMAHLAYLAVGNGLMVIGILIALAVAFLSAYPLWRQKRLAATLGFAVLGLIGLVLLTGFTFILFDSLFFMEPFLLVLLAVGLSGLVGFFFLADKASKEADAWLAGSLGLLIAYGIVLFMLFIYGLNSYSSPPEALVWLALAAFLLLPLAMLMRAAAYGWRDRKPFLAAAGMALPLLVIVPVILVGPAIGSSFGTAMLAALPPGQVEEAAPAASGGEPRLRQNFPETMLWLPEAVTDAGGALHLEFPAADSITTWRVTALASTKDGRLGSASAPLRVFQDFFIDLDLPLALTVGDEVAIPVGVYNYLPEAQTVRLEVKPAGWFELLDEPVKEISIGPNDIGVVHFRIRAKQFGSGPFQVTARGTQLSDAIQKQVRVYPDGKLISFTQSDRLAEGAAARQVIPIPAGAIAGSQTLQVKLYPGVFSQLVEGLDSLLRMPYGCFEQTSSITYPNVLALDYLKASEQAAPEVQMKAEQYINLGYQRLTTFEVKSSGGFSLFGEPPADRMLTAYGLQEFADMARVRDVDPDLIQRAADWLLSEQAQDGSWKNDRGVFHEDSWRNLKNDRLPVTAYIAWSLTQAGFGGHPGTQKGIAYVRDHRAEAQDAYTLALTANALVAADLEGGKKLSAATVETLDRLAGMAASDGKTAWWTSEVATFTGARGQTGSIETTALAALAFIRSGMHGDLANQALTFLVQSKDSFGTWHSTQATVLSLKALIESLRQGAESAEAAVTVTLNGGQARTLQVNRENFDVVQVVSFNDLPPSQENVVEISASGRGNLMYQVSGSYYLPWDLAQQSAPTQPDEAMQIQVTYDRAALSVSDSLTVTVSARLLQPGSQAQSALIDLGLPPGFSVRSEDLQALVAEGQGAPTGGPRIERYELTGRQILIYVSNLNAETPLQFSYRLVARYPLAVQTPASSVYDYYNPQISAEVGPQLLVVR